MSVGEEVNGFAVCREMKNIFISIINIAEREKQHKFSADLRPKIYLELLNAGTNSSEQVIKTVLSVDNDLICTGIFYNSRLLIKIRDHSQ